LRALSPGQKKIILVDFIILLFCILGVYNIINKSALPFPVISQNSNLVINNIEDNLSAFRKGDIIVSFENLDLKTIEEIEIFLDDKKPFDELQMTILRDDQLLNLKFELINYYSTLYNSIASIVGLMFFIVALIVLIKCDNEKLAQALHWSFVFTAMIIMMTWGNYSLLPYHFGIVTRIGFHIGYIFAPVFFLQFSILFPSHLNIKTKNIFNALYILAAILTFTLSAVFYLIAMKMDLLWIRTYIVVFDISSAFIVLIILSAIFVFIHTYSTTSIESDRKKLRWILLGFILGPLSYLTLWVIPYRIWNQPFIPEAVVLLLVAFVPITFGIAITKYRLLNVDIILKRGIVYFVVITILLIIYVLMISAAAKLLNNPDSEVSSIIAAISIALLFQPAKVRIQKYVDKKFFRVEYNYRLALNSFLNEIKDIYDKNEITEKVIEHVDNLIPVSRLGFFSFNKELNQMELTAHNNLENLLGKKIKVEQNTVSTLGSIPIAMSNNIESGVNVIKTRPREFMEIGSDLIFIIKSPDNNIHGFLTLGSRKSGTNFTAEDIDLLNIVTTRLSLTFDSIKLQEEVIREHLETERLEELNKLKSYFVSSVSHDLKTPLTSIKMFSEILKSSKNISSEKAWEYLNIIEGESNRLTRLIDNVLDYSMIEKGIKKYNFKIVEIHQIIKDVLKLMEYQFKIQKFKVKTAFYKDDLLIYADKDAIIEAIINIVSNSIKFSAENKSLNFTTIIANSTISVVISDAGIGISEKDIEKMFQPYFKSDNINIEQNKGSGLGMSIVKHIMDAHNGKINIKSEVNKGTTVSLEFPLKNFYDKDNNN